MALLGAVYITTIIDKEILYGRPRVLVGMSGVELFYEVYYELTGAECDVKPIGCNVRDIV